MKKILSISALLFIVISIQAQYRVTAASASTNTIPPAYQSIVVTTTAADTVGGTATKYWMFATGKTDLQLYTWVVKLDTIKVHSRSGGNRVKVSFYGSIDKSTWVQIGSSIYYNRNAGTLADSTFAVSDVSTGVLWPYLKAEFVGITANKCSKPQTIQLRVVSKRP
jgi:hypothetical protein